MTDRTEISARLMAVAEHTIVAEWICCEPLDPTHDLCAKGYATLKMTRALLVDDPEASVTAAPLLDAVMGLLPAATVPPPTQTDRRAQLLDALDFAYCQGLGFDTPEALLDAYDVSRGVPVPPPADQTALLQRIAEAIHRDLLAHRGRRDQGLLGIVPRLADAVLAVLPEQTDRAAVLRAADIAEDVAESLRKRHEFERSTGALDVMTELRRVAAEEQPAETQWPGERCMLCPPDVRTRQLEDHMVQVHGARPSARPAVGEQPETQEAPRRCAHTDITYGRCILPIPGHLDCFHEKQPIREDDSDEWGDGLCSSEYPGDDNFVGQLCALPDGHFGEHRRDEQIAGTSHTALLRWPNADRP